MVNLGRRAADAGETGHDFYPLYRFQNLLPLLLSLLLSYSAAAIGGLGSVNADNFYESLVRPSWAPPAWLFGPVWSILYTLIAISTWLLWLRKRFSVRLPYFVLGAQLVFNALWSWLFFFWQLGLIAVIEITLLWILIVINAVTFYRISKPAGLLLAPYLCWVSFAAILAIELWLKNPGYL